MSMMEVIGALLIALVVVTSVAIGINSGFSKSKIVNVEQDLVLTRMHLQQLFSGSTDYTGLDNEVAIKAGVVPKSLIKGNNLKSPWGGEINLSSNNANGSFKIELSGIPRDECTQLAKFQTDAWLSVTVNGNELDSTNSVTDIVNSCSSRNTIVYEAR